MKKLISVFLASAMLMTALCVSAAAEGYHIRERFGDGGKSLEENFNADHTFISDPGVLVGFSDDHMLSSRFSETDGIIDNKGNTWLEYDVEASISIMPDILYPAQREISLVYLNDNLAKEDENESRLFMSFGYDSAERRFFLAKTTNLETGKGDILLASPKREIDDEAERFYNYGISVTRGRIRCYFDNELIFDFVDEKDEYKIAKSVNSPFVLWTTNNVFFVNSIDISTPEYIYSPNRAARIAVSDDFRYCYAQGEEIDVSGGTLSVTYYSGESEIIEITPDMVSGFDGTKLGYQKISITYDDKTCEVMTAVVEKRCNVNDIDSDGRIGVGDAILILKHIAGWGVEIDEGLADVDGDGKVTIRDAISVMKFIVSYADMLGPVTE